MTADEAVAVFSSYSASEQAEFLAQLMVELTLVARDSYEVGGDGLIFPQRVRRINEVQHRISEFLWALLRNDSARYPDDVVLRIFLEQPDDPALGQRLNEAFARSAARRLTAA